MTYTEYPHLEQGTDEWLAARRGILTASVIGKLITDKTCKPASNPVSRSITRSLAAERITGHIEPVYVNDDMWRGTLDEPIARDLYRDHYATPRGQCVTEIGFMTRDDDGPVIGFSPDGLVDTDGLIEVKSRKQRKQVETIVSGLVPIENYAQLQTGLYVSGRDWIDYISYCGGMPMWIKRVHPEPRWFDAIIATARQFEANVDSIIQTYASEVEGLVMTERRDEGDDIEIKVA